MAHMHRKTIHSQKKCPLEWRRISAAAMASCLLLVSGCTTVDPIFVSKKLIITDYANSAHKEDATQYYGKLPKVIDDVNRYRYDMLTAVRTETAAKNLIGLTVVALSALTSYKLLTSNGAINEKWLAATGLGGAAAYFYGTNYISKPRALVYIAGADALNCMVLTSSAFLVTKEQFTGENGNGGLKGDISKLDAEIVKAHEVIQTSLRNIKTLGKEGVAKAKELARPPTSKKVCELPSVDLGSIGTLRTDLSRPQSKCRTITTKTGEDQSSVIFDVVQQQTKAITEYERLISSAKAVHADGQQLLASIDNAAEQLLSKAAKVVSKVNLEVLNVQPNLDAILQETGGLRSVGFQISGWSKLQPPAPQPVIQSDFDVTRARVTPELQEIISKIKKEGSDARKAIGDLAEALMPVRQQLLRTQTALAHTGKLAQCKLPTPANELSLEPDDASIVVAGPGKLAFRVKGGNGAPRVDPVGNAADKVTNWTATPSGSAYLVSVDLRAAPSGVDSLDLIFTDGDGNSPRKVTLVGISQAEGNSATSGTSIADTETSIALTRETAAKMCSKLGLDTGCYKSPESPPLAACRAALRQRGPLNEKDALSIIDTSRAECKPK